MDDLKPKANQYFIETESYVGTLIKDSFLVYDELTKVEMESMA